jgi:hypothetical protein
MCDGPTSKYESWTAGNAIGNIGIGAMLLGRLNLLTSETNKSAWQNLTDTQGEFLYDNFIRSRGSVVKTTLSISKLVTTNIKTIYLNKKKTFKIPVVIDYLKNNIGKETILYKSSNKKIATVSASGKIKAAKKFKKGTAKVTAYAKSNSAKEIVIKVKMSKKKVKLNKLTFKIKGAKKGKSKDRGKLILKNKTGKVFTTSLKRSPKKTTALKGITFKSSKKSLITIDKAGRITLKKALTKKQKKKTYKITLKAGGKKVVLKVKFR